MWLELISCSEWTRRHIAWILKGVSGQINYNPPLFGKLSQMFQNPESPSLHHHLKYVQCSTTSHKKTTTANEQRATTKKCNSLFFLFLIYILTKLLISKDCCVHSEKLLGLRQLTWSRHWKRSEAKVMKVASVASHWAVVSYLMRQSSRSCGSCVLLPRTRACARACARAHAYLITLRHKQKLKCPDSFSCANRPTKALGL